MFKGNYYLGDSRFNWLHQHPKCMISYYELHKRKKDINAGDAAIMIDSGAFTWSRKEEPFPVGPVEYAEKIERWSDCCDMVGCLPQDLIPGFGDHSIKECQEVTTQSYIDVRSALHPEINVLPILHGEWPNDYATHVEMYGDIIKPNQWVSVGGIVKHSTNQQRLVSIFRAIHSVRPDLKLHGLGMKRGALKSDRIRKYLYTADSARWAFELADSLLNEVPDHIRNQYYSKGLRVPIRKRTPEVHAEYIEKYLAELYAPMDSMPQDAFEDSATWWKVYRRSSDWLDNQ